MSSGGFFPELNAVIDDGYWLDGRSLKSDGDFKNTFSDPTPLGAAHLVVTENGLK
jgi:hypothetical protein